jgi:hypothetical protein
MENLSDDRRELQSPVYVLEAEKVIYEEVSTASCKAIDLGRRTRTALRANIIGTAFEKVLNHLGMAPVEKRRAWYRLVIQRQCHARSERARPTL